MPSGWGEPVIRYQPCLLGLVLLVLGCGSRAHPGKTARLALQAQHAVNADSVRVLPGEAARSIRQDGNTVFVELDLSSPLRQLRIEIPEMCPVFIDVGRLKPGETVLHPLVDLLDFGPERAQEGYGQRFQIAVEPGCQKAARGRIEWKFLGGSAPAEWLVADRGFLLRGRLPSMREAFGDVLPWGIVPISPRTRGQIRLHATFRDDAGVVGLERTLTVSAAARSTGVANVSIGKRVYLGGKGWSVRSRPDDSDAAVLDGDLAASITPDRSGRFVLGDAQDKSLVLMVGALDATPLDCGRTDCHPTISTGVSTSAMTSTWKRLLVPDAVTQAIVTTHGGAAGDDLHCAEICHTVGEPGLDDGGYRFTALALRRMGVADHGWDSLPSALRRQSGVGCLACHGPSAIPEPTARWPILRSDVCATCHDAPPTYGHSAAWRSTRMARSDRNERARTDAACVNCHTGWAPVSMASRPPAHVEAFGIGCATCHDVHPEGGATAGLLRVFPLPAMLQDVPAAMPGKSTVCLSCHTPIPQPNQLPQATAASIWLGRGGIDPVSGGPIESVSPHENVPGGCVGCHSGGGGRGGNHSFAVPGTACTGCHAIAPSRRAVADRARVLWDRIAAAAQLAPRSEAAPVHASMIASGGSPTLDRSTPIGRAGWNVLLVLEDPAADRHNGLYAERLLQSAETVLDGRKGKP
jgi:Cytochrome c554 and c-prime